MADGEKLDRWNGLAEKVVVKGVGLVEFLVCSDCNQTYYVMNR